jgi:hypothetical protein
MGAGIPPTLILSVTAIAPHEESFAEVSLTHEPSKAFGTGVSPRKLEDPS